jgi:hypothetical protein
MIAPAAAATAATPSPAGIQLGPAGARSLTRDRHGPMNLAYLTRRARRRDQVAGTTGSLARAGGGPAAAAAGGRRVRPPGITGPAAATVTA